MPTSTITPTRIPSRVTNYYLAREHEHEEVPWYRTTDEALLDLPGPVALVNGAFDILHAGHMKVIFAARKRARSVVVALDSDARCARKGPGRPIQSFIERAVTLNYMPVDAIVEIETDEDMRELLTHLNPAVRVQGWDHRGTTSKFPKWKKCFVRNGPTRTSRIIERIREGYVKGSE